MPIFELRQRVGFGQERLIVRGQRFLELPRAAALRPSYNEYPERYPLVEGFPRPGQRGGSRPAPGPGAGAGGEGGAGGFTGPSGSVYPASRDRPAQAAPSGSSYGASGAPAGSPFCDMLAGGAFGTADTVPAVTTTVVVTPEFPFPFIITVIQAWANSVVLSAARFNVKVSDDNSSTGGVNCTGVSIVLPPGVPDNTVLDVVSDSTIVQPNFIVSEPGKFIKLILNNASAGPIPILIRGSYQRLP